MLRKQRNKNPQNNIKAWESYASTHALSKCCHKLFGLNCPVKSPDNCIILVNIIIEQGYNTGPDPKENQLLSEINLFSSLKTHLNL